MSSNDGLIADGRKEAVLRGDGQDPPEESVWFDSCVGVATVFSGEEDAERIISIALPRKFLTME